MKPTIVTLKDHPPGLWPVHPKGPLEGPGPKAIGSPMSGWIPWVREIVRLGPTIVLNEITWLKEIIMFSTRPKVEPMLRPVFIRGGTHSVREIIRV